MTHNLIRDYNKVYNKHYKELIGIKKGYFKEVLDMEPGNHLDLKNIKINDAIEVSILITICNFMDCMNGIAMCSPSKNYFNIKLNQIETIYTEVNNANSLVAEVWTGLGLTDSGLVLVMESLSKQLFTDFVSGVEIDPVKTDRTVYTIHQISSSTINVCNMLRMILVNLSMLGFESEFGGLLIDLQSWISETKKQISFQMDKRK